MTVAGDLITLVGTVTVDVLIESELPELVALAKLVQKLETDLNAAIMSKDPALAVEVTGADVAADVAEDKKFPPPTGGAV